MNPRPSVLCPIDFSDASRGALRYAAAIAQHFFGDLTVLAVDHPLLNEAADATLEPGRLAQHTREQSRLFFDETFVDRTPALAEVRFESVVGTPAATIVRRARESRVDLVVMSTHGLTGMATRVLGSTTERVLRETTVPVLVTPPRDQPPQTLHDIQHTMRRVVVPLDLSPVNATQLRIAQGIADAMRVELVIVHALDPIPWVARLADQVTHANRARHRDAAAALSTLQHDIGGRPADRTVIREGHAADVILAVASEVRHTLVVMALHGERGGPRVGAITYRLVSHASQPVLALPSALCLPKDAHTAIDGRLSPAPLP